MTGKWQDELGNGFKSTDNNNKMKKGRIMAKKTEGTDSVYKVTEIVGTSTKSWEDAAKNAVETAGRSLRDLRVAEVVKTDVTVENGKVKAYRAREEVSFKYED